MAKQNPPPKIKGTEEEIQKSEALNQLEKELSEFNPNLFKNIKPQKKEELLQSLISFTLIHEQSHSGPIPAPQSMAEYNSIIPNGADRIMTMAESQQTHRLAIEKKSIGRQSFQSLLGQIFGFIIAIFCIYKGSDLAMNGHPTAGALLVGTTVVSLVYVFVVGKKKQNK